MSLKKIANKRTFWIASTVFALAFLFCIGMFFRAKNFSCYREGQVDVTFTGTAGERTSIYEGIALDPGVYRVTVESATDLDTLTYLDVAADVVSPGGIRCIGAPVYAGLTETTFTFYLYEKVQNLSLDAFSSTAMTVHVGNLRLEDTGYLWSMGAFWVCIIYGIFMLAFFLWEKGKRGEISRESLLVFLALSAICILSCLPFLYGYNLNGADNGYHELRIEGLLAGWKAGYFPVRIEPYWQQGYGYANSIFYNNLFLSLPAFLRLLGFSVGFAWNAYCILILVALVVVTWFCAKRIFPTASTAVCVTGIYALSLTHYHKAAITGAVGEATAMIFLPLVLLGLYRIFFEDPDREGYRTAFVPLAFGYVGILSCHVLSGEITVLMTLIFVLSQLRKLKDPKVFLALIKAAFSALVLSLWFLLPFLEYYIFEDVHVKHVFARTIQNRGVQIPQMFFHFWTTDGGNLYDGMYRGAVVGLGLIPALGFAWLLVLFLRKKLGRKAGKLACFGRISLWLGLFACLLALRIFPWDAIQSHAGFLQGLVSGLQFPNRFLGWGTLLGAVCFGCVMEYYRQVQAGWQLKILQLLTVFGILTSALFLLDSYMTNVSVTNLYNPEGIQTGYISGGEYLIEGTDPSLLLYNRLGNSENILILSHKTGDLAGTMVVVNTTEEEGYVEFPLLHYRGYTAWDGEGNPLECIKGDNNVVRVLIPGGYHGEVFTQFREPVVWRIAEGISLAGWVAAAVILFRYRRRRVLSGGEAAELFFLPEANRFSRRERSLILLTAGILLAWLPSLASYNPEGMIYPSVLEAMPAALQGLVSRLLVLCVFGIPAVGYYAVAARIFRRSGAASYGALCGSLAWILAPCHLYLVYDAGAKEATVSGITGLFQLFVRSSDLYAGEPAFSPMHVSALILPVTGIWIYLTLVRKKGVRGRKTEYDRPMILITVPAVLLAVGGCYAAFLLPLACLAFAVQITVFVVWIFDAAEDPREAKAILAALVLLLVFGALYQLEDICFHSYPGMHGMV